MIVQRSAICAVVAPFATKRSWDLDRQEPLRDHGIDRFARETRLTVYIISMLCSDCSNATGALLQGRTARD